MKNRLRTINESINEAQSGVVVIDHKNKKFIILDNTGWSALAEPISKLAGALEGTGDKSIEVVKGADTSALLNDGYNESDNMTLTPVLESAGALNENYGEELDALQKAFDKVVAAMKGSSAADPKQIWLDLGLRNQFCDEEGNIL